MYKLSNFSFTDMMECRARLRGMFDDDPATLSEAAERVVRFFYDELRDEDGEPACALVRLFKTHPFEDLDPASRAFALKVSADANQVPGLRCLVLLATAGSKPDWNSREASRGHRAIPLLSERMVSGAPMIAQLINQLGVKISTVLKPDSSVLLDSQEVSYNVFYVREALNSPYIVAQKDFVEPYKIRSVLGFGGMLASGDLFAVILFSRVEITPIVADLFKVLGLNLRIAVLPLARRPLA